MVCEFHEGIMANRFTRELNLGRRQGLGFVAAEALAGPGAIGLTTAPRSRAQPPAAATALPKFDVASVKPLDQLWRDVGPSRSGGRITWKTDLRDKEARADDPPAPVPEWLRVGPAESSVIDHVEKAPTEN
ncbi:MAG TPA: hypothetical protein VKF41_10090 [Bryobacteraceae bacterium]|nr:hypothetical protein [Bryobacteraceae bacterium]